jgi:hypothetical protein
MRERASRRCIAATTTLAMLVALAISANLAAAASSATDPQGDVLSCTGECSLYNQDLKSISVAISGGTLLITVSQYGPFTSATKYYWPAIDLYTTTPDPTKPPDLPDLDTEPADYYLYKGFSSDPQKSQLIHVGPAGWAASHQVIETSVAYTNPDASTVVYSIPLADIGSPASVRARAWQGGTRDTGSHRVVDWIPDSGVVGGGSTGGSGFGRSTAVSFAGSRKVKVKGAIATFLVKNANGFSVNGTLSVLTRGVLRASAGAQAAKTTTLGRKAFKAAARRTVAVKVKLSRKARRALAKRGRLKVTEAATVRDPSGASRKISRTITLVRAKKKGRG